MESHKHLQFKTFVLIIAGLLGNVLLGRGMQSVGMSSIASDSDLLHVSGRVFAPGAIWLGVASLLTFFVAELRCRRLGGMFFLGEPISLRR